jgi:hypothetical protein
MWVRINNGEETRRSAQVSQIAEVKYSGVTMGAAMDILMDIPKQSRLIARSVSEMGWWGPITHIRGCEHVDHIFLIKTLWTD